MIKYGLRLFTLCLVPMLLGLTMGCSKSTDDGPAPTPPIDKSANLLGTGESANDILSNNKFTKVLMEIAYVTDFRPTAAAIFELTNYLKQHTFKEDIEVVYKELPSPNKQTLSLQEIADLETENRTAYNSGSTMAVYIYFADAASEEDNEAEGLVTLGAVYRNTTMVIHEVTVRKLAGQSPLIQVSDVESATLNHEFGHLLGLVNLDSNPETPVNPHEDPDAESHCHVPGCLMLAELQFVGTAKSATSKIAAPGSISSACSLSGKSVMKLLEQPNAKGAGAAPPLDAECILDLQANGGR